LRPATRDLLETWPGHPIDKNLAVLKAESDPLLWTNGIVIPGVLALIIETFFG